MTDKRDVVKQAMEELSKAMEKEVHKVDYTEVEGHITDAIISISGHRRSDMRDVTQAIFQLIHAITDLAIRTERIDERLAYLEKENEQADG